MINTLTVFDLIEHMNNLIRSEERKKCAALGLQEVHLQVLTYLSCCNRYSDTPAALTNYLGRTMGTVSQTLSLLEKKGYIKKMQDLSDKRVVHLVLTVEGRAIMEQAKPAELFIKALSLMGKQNAIERYVNCFDNALTALQVAHHAQTFGVCRTCRHITQTEDGQACSLFKEKLSLDDSQKICQYHTAITWWQ